MALKSVWFNKGFSSLYTIMDLIRKEDRGERYHLVCSHSSPEFVGFLTSDTSEVEPTLMKDEDYLAYCLDFCRRHNVRMFMPARRMNYLTSHRSQFKEIGVQILAAADFETLELIHNKAALYERLSGEDIVPIPSYTVVNDKSGFNNAVEQIWSEHGNACFKPTSSVYGLGFRILTKSGREFDRLLNGDTVRIGVDYAGSLIPDGDTFRDLMVMQYLEGRERSIDCLADHGNLLASVIRLKPGSEGGAQLLEDNPEIELIASRITSTLGLDGLYNIQLKESNGVSYLLEINPRMSGGLQYACMSGLNFPYWALRSADGSCRPDDIPRPKTGLRVSQITQGVLAKG